jgi:hypothetical protein
VTTSIDWAKLRSFHLKTETESSLRNVSVFKNKQDSKDTNAFIQCYNKSGYWPLKLKTAQVITMLKPGRDPTNVESYRPISLLPTISKLSEKLVHKRLQEDLEPKEWMPDQQFGFRRDHSTVQQCHRITDVIKKALENQQYRTAAFLDVTRAFDRVWHKGLLVKIKRTRGISDRVRTSVPRRAESCVQMHRNHMRHLL